MTYFSSAACWSDLHGFTGDELALAKAAQDFAFVGGKAYAYLFCEHELDLTITIFRMRANTNLLCFRRLSGEDSSMSIWEKLAGAATGMLRNGTIGGFLGGNQERDGQAEDQVAFTVGVIALGAKMAKADGVVTDDEVNAFKEVFKIPAGEMKNVAQIFNLAKKDVTGYEVYAEQLASMLKGNRELLQDVLEGLFHIAKADKVLHPARRSFSARSPSVLASPILSSATSRCAMRLLRSAILTMCWGSTPRSAMTS